MYLCSTEIVLYFKRKYLIDVSIRCSENRMMGIIVFISIFQPFV